MQNSRFLSSTLFVALFSCLLMGMPQAMAQDHDHGHQNRKSGSPDPKAYHKFVPNRNQWNPQVRYMADMQGGRLWLRHTGFTYTLYSQDQINSIHDFYHHGPMPPPDRRMENELVDLHSFEVEFLGANPQSQHQAEHPSDHYINFYLGNDPAKWATGVRAFQEISYRALYPGIDMHMVDVEGRLKYEFLLAPGADPNLIRMQYKGMDGLEIVEGELNVRTSVGVIKEMRPYAYQDINGQRRAVPCEFLMEGDQVSFQLPQGYDPAYPLVIDPTLVGATYSGSSATCFGHTATYDDLGNIYAGGICFGTGFPTTIGAMQMAFGGSTDQAINKYSPTATALIWSTYIGGSSGDYPHSMISNNQGELVVLGTTGSGNFPVSATGFQQGLNGFGDITVTVLNATATALTGSTYVGGSMSDGVLVNGLGIHYGDSYRGEVIVDGSDNIYIASGTESSDFPTTPGVFQPGMSGTSDGVAFKLSPNVSTMIWSTYIGGTGDEFATSIKLNAAGEVYLVGGTSAQAGFPTTPGALNPNPMGNEDGFLLRLNPTATTVMQGTYLGTATKDLAYFVEIDASGFPYVLGEALGYPVSPGVYSQPGGELFIDKLTGNLSTSLASTVIGDATAGLSPTAFLVDICGNVYAAAWGSTAALPVTPNAFQPVGGADFYLITLAPNFSSLLYATNFGGSAWEHVDGGTSRFDKRGAVYESSCSNSPNWPTTPGAVFPASGNGGSYDVVCFKFEFNFINIASSFATAQAPSGCAPFNVTFVNQSSTGPTTFYHWDFGNGDTDTSYNPTYTYNAAGTYTVTLIVTDTSSCMGSDTSTLVVEIIPSPPITLNQDTIICNADSVQLHATTLPGATYLWSPSTGLTNPNIPNPIASPPGGSMAYTLTLTDSAGCVSTGTINVNLSTFIAEAGPPASYCEGTGGAQLQAGLPSGGQAPYYYTWWCNAPICGLDSINDDDPRANPSANTWYYLQVTDFNGCLSEVDSMEVEVKPLPLVDAGPDVGICQSPAPGALITANVLNAAQAPGPYIVQWIPATGLNDPSIFSPYARPDTTTIYAAVVYSANGCNSEFTTIDTTSTITVTVHPLPIADAGPDIHLCLGDTQTIQGIGHGAGPGYDFQWSPATGLSDSAIANPLASPGFTHHYSLTVWSNGCPSYGDTMVLNVHTLPTPSAGNIVEVCLGEAGQLDAFGAGDSTANYTYQWWPAAGLSDPTAENPLASPDSSTVYYLEVMSNHGCRSPLDSVLVRLKPTPIAEAGPEQQFCAGQTFTLLGGYHYASTDSANPSEIYFQWSPPLGLSDPALAQPQASPAQSMWYHLQVTHNTCLTEDSVLVILSPTPVPVVSADTLTACEGVPVQLHASGGQNAVFSWSPAAGLDSPSIPNPIATPATTTTYLLSMEEGGCITQVPLTLTILPSPKVEALGSNPAGCIPFPVHFLESSHTTLAYAWDFGDGSPVSNEPAPSHTYLRPGTYPVVLTGTNTGGCSGKSTPIMVTVADTLHPDFSLAAAGMAPSSLFPLVLELPDAIAEVRNTSVGPATDWAWDFGDGEISHELNAVHAYAQAGMYMVTLRSVNPEGCVSRLVKGPVIVLAPDLFIPNVFTPNGDGIGDAFLVEYAGSQPFELKVYDRWGAPMYTSQNKLAGWDGQTMQGQKVPEGTYYYALSIGKKDYSGSLTLLR